jgi:hypothetical protein
MRRFASVVVLGLLAVALAPRAEAQSAASCIHVLAQARYGASGYNHIVHVANSCGVAFSCLVSTDVNPEPQTVVVGPNSQTEVNTFLGSPARVFTPKVACVAAR